MQKITTWTNLHRHGEFSFFDGFGKYTHAAAHAKEMGQQALGIAEHGTVSGLVKHYQACKENDIKPILGCEIYFQPKFDKEKPSYHMCLFCKDLKGYQNLMAIITEANSKCFYRHANVTLSNLKRHSQGLICSTACIGGWPSQAILKGNIPLAERRIEKLYSIFGEDLYIEIMPYTVMENGQDLQKTVDKALIKIIEENGYKGIITTDSHYIKAEDYETFQLLFKIKKKNFDNDYSQRYMPDEAEVKKRFEIIYKKYATEYIKNTIEIANKCNVDLESFKEVIPKANDTGIESKKLLRQLVAKGLKKEGKYRSSYIKRAKDELEVIEHLGFEEYFLICWDVVKHALDNNIGYGPGRGSVCGSLAANALNITKVDPLEIGTLFERFLRKDKKSLPKIRCWAIKTW